MERYALRDSRRTEGRVIVSLENKELLGKVISTLINLDYDIIITHDEFNTIIEYNYADSLHYGNPTPYWIDYEEAEWLENGYIKDKEEE